VLSFWSFHAFFLIAIYRTPIFYTKCADYVCFCFFLGCSGRRKTIIERPLFWIGREPCRCLTVRSSWIAWCFKHSRFCMLIRYYENSNLERRESKKINSWVKSNHPFVKSEQNLMPRMSVYLSGFQELLFYAYQDIDSRIISRFFL
jgi:hypothetical protein